MAKFIYAKSKAGFDTAYGSSLEAIDKSIAFMEDGWIWTHGKFFRLHPENWSLTATASGSTVTVKDGDNTVFSFDRGVVSVTASDLITASTSNGAVTIKHNTLSGNAAVTVGPTANASTSIVVPQITFDKYGHYSSVQNRTATLNQVLSAPIATAANQYLVGSANAASNTGSLNKVSSIFFNADTGTLNATVFKENGSILADLYAPKSHTTVKATGSTLGHVTLSDSIESTSGAGAGIAATPNAVKQVYDYAKSILSAGDAMLFMGLIGGSAKITGKPEVNDKTFTSLTNYAAGWTFKVQTAQTIPNIGTLEVGDMIIAINSSATYKAADWTVVQADIDGAVTAGATLTTDQIVLGAGTKTVKSLVAGTSGQVLQSNGVSAPSWVSKWYRQINVNGTSVLGGTSSTAVDFIAGTGISITNASGKLTFATTLSNFTLGGVAYSPTGSAVTIGLNRGLSMVSNNIGHSNSITAQTSTALRSIAYDAHGHITASTVVTALPTPNKISFSDGKATPTKIDFDGSATRNIKFLPATGDIKINAEVSGTDLTYTLGLTHRYRPIAIQGTAGSATETSVFNDTTATKLTLKAGSNITMTNASGVVTINAKDTADTWRDVHAYSISGTSTEVLSKSISTAALKFASDFIWADNELNIGWAEVAANGTITYEY